MLTFTRTRSPPAPPECGQLGSGKGRVPGGLGRDDQGRATCSQGSGGLSSRPGFIVPSLLLVPPAPHPPSSEVQIIVADLGVCRPSGPGHRFGGRSVRWRRGLRAGAQPPAGRSKKLQSLSLRPASGASWPGLWVLPCPLLRGIARGAPLEPPAAVLRQEWGNTGLGAGTSSSWPPGSGVGREGCPDTGAQDPGGTGTPPGPGPGPQESQTGSRALDLPAACGLLLGRGLGRVSLEGCVTSVSPMSAQAHKGPSRVATGELAQKAKFRIFQNRPLLPPL